MIDLPKQGDKKYQSQIQIYQVDGESRISAKPDKPESGTCPNHGEYEVKVNPLLNKFYRRVQCPSCVSEKEADQRRLDDLYKQDRARAIKCKQLLANGISKRNLYKTLDGFNPVNEKQAKAKAMCKALAEKVVAGEQGFNLIMSGSVGTGKTHLASSTVAHCIINNKRAHIIKLVEIIRDIKETWNSKESSEQNVINFFTRLDLLVIDEVGVQFGSDTEKMFVFDIIDGRYENMLPTIIISNRDLNGIKELLGERCVDRLREDGGKVLAFDWESYRGKK